MERLRYSPHNRQDLVRWLLDKDTPRGPDPRQWVEQADMYQEKYGHDDEIEQASKLLQARLGRVWRMSFASARPLIRIVGTT